MNIFAELKRRNVFKVAAAYIIVGWLIMQAGEVMSPALRLPEWVNSTLAFFLILGFPVALVFAWAFEMTPDGLKKEKEVDRSQSITPVTGQKLNYTIIALMAVALAYFAWDKFSTSEDNIRDSAQAPATAPAQAEEAIPEVQKPDRKSIAVIPFQNRSANEENSEFFSDGVHDELLTNLSKIGDLKVISRTSVMSYRDTTKNIQQIAKELGVANILEGGVQRAGDTVRINVQLIDAATDEHLWAEIYDRQLSAENIFTIQAEIARAIAGELEATLSPQEQALLKKQPTDNLDAFDNWMIASQLISRGNWQDLRDAKQLLEKAIELDPQYVQAYVSLAFNYFNLFETGATTLEEINPDWSQAIQAALSLDKNNAGAYAAKALYLWKNGHEGVEGNFDKARKLAPRDAEIMVFYGQYLRKTFHPNEALPLYLMAKELNPVSIDVLYGLSRIHIARREWEEALEIFTKIRHLYPSAQTGYGPVAAVLMATGNMAQYTRWIFKGLEIDPDDTDLYNWVALAYIDFGKLDTARQWLEWIEENQANHVMTYSGMAMLNIYEGNTESSILYSRPALERQMPGRFGSNTVLVRALLIWALDQGQTKTALELVQQNHPELFKQNPRVVGENISQAIDTARLLLHENHEDEATDLLLAALAAYEKPFAVTESWQTSGKAQALALLDRKQAALTELQRIVDDGWRVFWRWHTEMNPNFASLHDDPEFQAIVEFLRQDMARQGEELQVLEAAGDIPAPPGGEDR